MDSNISPYSMSGQVVDSQVFVDLQLVRSFLPMLQNEKIGLALESLICQVLQPHPLSV